MTGEVVVALTTDRTERLAPGTVLASDRGPLTVIASRPHQGRWLVTFDGVMGREAADAMRDVVLRAEPLDDPEALWVHELIGATVVDGAAVVVGVVTAVQDNPAGDLLVLDGSALVPIRFVVGWDPDRRVVIDPPEGLFDL